MTKSIPEFLDSDRVVKACQEVDHHHTHLRGPVNLTLVKSKEIEVGAVASSYHALSRQKELPTDLSPAQTVKSTEVSQIRVHLLSPEGTEVGAGNLQFPHQVDLAVEVDLGAKEVAQDLKVGQAEAGDIGEVVEEAQSHHQRVDSQEEGDPG